MPTGRNKFRNRRTTVDGITFDSKKEAERYSELQLLQRAGTISGLECQPEFDLIVEGSKVGKYVADFRYQERGETIVEDVKGGNATKTPVYKLKRKLMRALYGIEICEI